MKKIIYLILSIYLLVSCNKVNETPQTNNETINETIRIYGKWLLIGGSMYVDNLATNQKIRYDHFGPNRTISSLNYNGSNIEFETIEIDKTTWSFYQPNYVPGSGEFLLNGDTTKLYGFYVTRNNWSIIEHHLATPETVQMGGSSRPIRASIFNYSDSIVYFYVQTAYTSSGGYNYRYFSELKFKKIESW